MTQLRASQSAFGELDIWLARAGRHEELYAKLGAHPVETGVRFAVWAPNASYVSVVGDFNGWDAAADPLRGGRRDRIWEGTVEGAEVGQRYKSSSTGTREGRPVAFQAEVPPKHGVDRLRVATTSGTTRNGSKPVAPVSRSTGRSSIYEVHAQSWRKGLDWRGLARELDPVRPRPRLHARRAAARDAASLLGVVGLSGDRLLRPHSALGSPDDFRFFVDELHQAGSA